MPLFAQILIEPFNSHANANKHNLAAHLRVGSHSSHHSFCESRDQVRWQTPSRPYGEPKNAPSILYNMKQIAGFHTPPIVERVSRVALSWTPETADEYPARRVMCGATHLAPETDEAFFF